jgi:hypothetical protein
MLQKVPTRVLKSIEFLRTAGSGSLKKKFKIKELKIPVIISKALKQPRIFGKERALFR